MLSRRQLRGFVGLGVDVNNLFLIANISVRDTYRVAFFHRLINVLSFWAPIIKAIAVRGNAHSFRGS